MKLSMLALAAAMLVPTAWAEKITKHTVDGDEEWYWTKSVTVKRGQAQTFWIKGLTEDTAIDDMYVYGTYSYTIDGEKDIGEIEATGTMEVENSKGGFDFYVLLSADDWESVPTSVKSVKFTVMVEGDGEDAEATDLSFTFGNAAGKKYPFLKPVVTFNANGGLTEESSREVTSGETLGGLPAAEKAGADFIGWFTAKSGGIEVSEETVITKDVTYYAHWAAAYLSFEAQTVGNGDSASFYWSLNGGTTKYPCGDSKVPLEVGKKTVTFYAIDEDTGKASSAWYVPEKFSFTLASDDDEEEVSEFNLSVWFVAKENSVSVKFDANGGSVSPASMYFVDGDSFYSLPTPTRKGYVFSGWYTAKSGGDQILVGDDFDTETLGSKKPTLYAHWLKAYDLTLKGNDVTAIYGEVEYTKSVSVMQGGSVTLMAPNEYTDSKNVEYLFQCWTPSASYDFGEGYSASCCETEIVMPAAKLTMTATYVKASEAAWLTMYATGATVEVGDITIEPDTSKFYWSVDGKSWFRSGATAILKKGTYTVQWKSTSDSWAAPTAKTKKTLAAGDEESNEESPAVFSFETAASVTAVVYENGECRASTEGGTVSMNPANGRIPSGKTLTLTAKPNKGYAFVGWMQASNWDGSSMSFYLYSVSATQKISSLDVESIDGSDGKVHFQAIFRPTSDYSEEAMNGVFQSVYTYGSGREPTYDEEGNGLVELQAVVGCKAAFNFKYGCNAEAWPLTVKVASGKLPSGLKFDSTEGTLSGTPTTAGTYQFTVKATNPAGHTCLLAVTLTVSKLSSSIAGNYRSLLKDSSGAYAGLLEMSVTAAGKASAKIITTTGTITLKPSLAWYESEGEGEDDDGGTYTVVYEKMSTKSATYFCAYLDSEGSVSYSTYTYNGDCYSESAISGTLLASQSSWLKDADFKTSFLNKYYTVVLSAAAADAADSEDSDSSSYRTPTELTAPGYLTVTVDKNGAVKVAGKLADGEKISTSTVLLPAADGSSASVVLFAVPSAYKKKGSVALQLNFSSDGTVSSSVGTWVTPPLLATISGVDCESEIFLPGMLSLTANGAIYSKFTDLTGYYLDIAASVGSETPQMEIATTYSEDGEKWTEYSYVDALLQFGNPVLTGGKSGKVTVGKSAAPWKDSEGAWHYDVTKEDSEGETKEITNPSGLTISFTSATGVFSGKFNIFFDWETSKWNSTTEEETTVNNHKAVSCAYSGVVVRGESSAMGYGSALYSSSRTFTYTTTDAKGNETSAKKTYTMKCAIPVSWSLEEGSAE